MADWRYIASRLNGNGTETILHSDLPLGEVSITDTLSGPQAISASIAPEVTSLLGADGQPIFDPWSTAVYAEKDGTIRAGGILTDMVASGPTLNLDCLGFSAYAKDMPYTGANYVGKQVDALDAFRFIWAHLQSQTRGNLGLTFDTIKAGFKLDRPMSWHTTHDLYKEMQDLVREATFDYRELHSWNGETIAHSLDFGVPQIGRRRDDLRFVVGENVAVIPDVGFDGDSYASEVVILGAGEGAKMQRGGSVRSAETRLRRVAVMDEKAAGTKAKADAYAKQALALLTGRAEIASIRVFDHPHAALGSWSIGDEIFIQLPSGWQGDLGIWARVTSHTITPDDETAATLSVVRAKD